MIRLAVHLLLWPTCQRVVQVLLPDAISFSAAISACEKAFQWPAALLLLADVQSCSLELDIILCNAALSSCSKGPAQ